MDTSKQKAVCAILGASVMWALEPVLARLAYGNSDFLQTSAIRAIIVTLMAALYVMVTNRGRFAVAPRQIAPLIYLGLAGTVVADLLYFYALSRIPIINAVLIGHMQPVFIILFGWFILKTDRLTRFDYLGIAIMMAAGLLVTAKTPANLCQLHLGTAGDLLVLLATVAWATTALVMRKYLPEVHAGIITFYRYAIASAALAGYLLFTSSLALANIYQILIGIIIGIGTILYYEGLKRITAAQVSALELATPFFAALLGFVFLRETVTIMQMAGIGLLMVGIYFLARKEES